MNLSDVATPLRIDHHPCACGAQQQPHRHYPGVCEPIPVRILEPVETARQAVEWGEHALYYGFASTSRHTFHASTAHPTKRHR